MVRDCAEQDVFDEPIRLQHFVRRVQLHLSNSQQIVQRLQSYLITGYSTVFLSMPYFKYLVQHLQGKLSSSRLHIFKQMTQLFTVHWQIHKVYRCAQVLCSWCVSLCPLLSVLFPEPLGYFLVFPLFEAVFLSLFSHD